MMNEDLYFYTYNKCCFPLDNSDYENTDFLLLGIPFDSTQTGRTGSRYGPSLIRLASYESELFDFETQIDLSEISLHDIGDIDCVPGNPESTNARIAHTCKNMKKDAFWLVFGGEHSITYPVVQELRPDIVVSFDAHPDLREEYMDLRLSHSSVMRRIHEDEIDVMIFGVREGSKEELAYANKNNIPLISPSSLSEHELPMGKNIYISIDLDVFDNLLVGNPTPGGLDFTKFCKMLRSMFIDNNVVGVDIVELCTDSIDSSAFFASKLTYKLLAYSMASNMLKNKSL